MPDNSNSNGGFALVNVPGSEKVSQTFKEKVGGLAADLGTNPNFLITVMSFETGETFDPAKRNKVSGAVGLIQFMKPTAQGLGTTQEALARMTAEDQLDFVAKHFKPFKGRLKSLEDTYMAVLFPAAVGKAANHVLFPKPSVKYTQNDGLDINKDGEITVCEAADRVRAKLGAAGAGVGQTPRRGSQGPEVQRLQEEMVDIGYLTRAQLQTGPGRFGPQTDAALKTFQRNHGIDPTGVLTDQTYQALLLSAHDAIPRTDLHDSTSVETVLPEKGVGFVTFNREPGGRDQFGRASTVRAIQQLGELWHDRHPTVPIAIGDMSRRGGGPFPPHASHTDGRDAHIRPLTNNGRNEPTNINAANFSHALTRELILLIRETFNPEVIFFNDPLTIREGLTRRASGHHNHLHVRFR